MTAIWLETRGAVYLVLYSVLIGYAVRHLVALVRDRSAGVPMYPAGWSAWHRGLMTAVNVAGAAGLFVACVLLMRAGPSLAQVLSGHARGSAWGGVLFYTSAWVWSLRPIRPVQDRPSLVAAPYAFIGMRAVVLGFMFFLAIASIEDW
jgi:hypothetical protein